MGQARGGRDEVGAPRDGEHMEGSDIVPTGRIAGSAVVIHSGGAFVVD